MKLRLIRKTLQFSEKAAISTGKWLLPFGLTHAALTACAAHTTSSLRLSETVVGDGNDRQIAPQASLNRYCPFANNGEIVVFTSPLAETELLKNSKKGDTYERKNESYANRTEHKTKPVRRSSGSQHRRTRVAPKGAHGNGRHNCSRGGHR